MPSKMIRHRSMSYLDIGQGFPVLLGHAYLGNKQDWLKPVEILSKNFRCIVPDLWSHGQSGDIPQKPYSLELLSEDLYYLMKSIGLPEFAIAGASVSGMWAAQMAINRPRHVKALVLIDTYLGDESEERKLYYGSLLQLLEKEGRFTHETLDEILPYLFAKETFEKKPFVTEAFKQNLLKIPFDRMSGLLEAGSIAFNRSSMLSRLPSLTMPTLILSGDQDIPMPVESVKSMADLNKNFVFHLISQAGHYAYLEQEDMITQALQAFFIKTLKV